MADDLGHQARLVGVVENPGEGARGPDAAETAVDFEQPHLRTAAGRVDRRGNPGRACTADDDVALFDDRHFASRLVEDFAREFAGDRIAGPLRREDELGRRRG